MFFRTLAIIACAATASLFAAEATAPVVPPPATLSGKDTLTPPEGVFSDSWKEVFVNGQKIGFAHEVMRREGDRVFTASREEYKIGRLFDVAEMSSSIYTDETLDGEPRAFRSTSRQAGEPSIVNGRGNSTLFNISIQNGSYANEPRVTFPAGTVMSWGMDRLTRLKGLTPGTKYDVWAYDPTSDPVAPLMMNVTVGEKEKISIHSRVVEATRVDVRLHPKGGAPPVESTLWIGPDFATLKESLSLGPMKMESIACTEKEALADYQPSDVFDTSILHLDQPIPANATEVVLHLRRPEGKPLPLPPDSLTAHNEAMPDGAVRMTLIRPSLAKPAGDTPLSDRAQYLVPNSYLNTDDPRLRRLAADNGGPANSPPAAVAAKLRDFVSEYISEKDLSVGFATASETAQSRRGDCTEHAVLLAALGRIRGLPSRVVCGLAFMPTYLGHKNALVFHMWTQFYIDGQWRDYDSALDDAARPVYWRLGFAANGLDDVSLSDFSLGMMGWMDDLKVSLETARQPQAN